MNKAEFAAASMTSGTTNCAQSVINVFCEELGLEKSLALKLALGFGGGMGHTGQTCGAVTAAYMVLGLEQDFNPAIPKQYRDRVYALVAEFNRRFIKIHGSINCTRLLGYDLSTPEGEAAVKEKGLSQKLCPKFVHDAVEIVEGIEF
jgi:C_GCAxxG_C_C family probable redox protein